MSRFQLINGRYVIDKDPESKLDYGIRMAAWLVLGDSLTGAAPVWTLSAGLVNLGEGVDGTTAFIKLGGGVLEAMEWAQCHWTTAQGREEEQTLYFNMVNK